MPTVQTSWAPDDAAAADLDRPRNDFVAEQLAAPGVFVQEHGPFSHYRRELSVVGDRRVERIDYRLAIPWFGWLFAIPVKRVLRHRRRPGAPQPWWAPAERIDERQALVLGLLAAASILAGYLNTLFTQTATFAAKDFGISKHGQGIAGTIVRLGIIVALPLLFLADRIGRRRAMVFAAWGGPAVACLGALAPSFALLTASQTLSRPLGLALDGLIAVVAAEEVPRGSRAYALSVLAMAAGLGAGLCVIALPLADIGRSGWRLVYVVPVILTVISLDLFRRLPETKRFERPHRTHLRLPRRRFALLAATAFIGNLFVAPASFFQNNYLETIRGFSATRISLFTLATQTPAGLGLVVGGRLADVRGRRVLAASALTISTLMLVISFAIGGWVMWTAAFVGGFVAGTSYPALFVYRTELFATGNRSWAGGLVTAMALGGGGIGLLSAGSLLDHHSYGAVMGSLALAEVVVAALVLFRYPETARRELEELNPEDAIVAAS